ncbi:MAG: PEP-CTERM sorting domain-containing protein [Bryobacteraceae bacterium]|nr:PEP-CTERM sorting domain-containing protein [Bryobacteraceae bacterium]
MTAARHFIRIWALGAVLVGNSFAVTLYEQNFDGLTPALNAALSEWFIYRPAIDIVADNTLDIRCQNNTGNCVDLDGTYMQGTHMWSQQTYQFQEGFRYVLSFWLSGNQRDLTATDTLFVRLGSLVQEFNLLGSAAWQNYTMELLGDGSSGKILFDQRGNPNPYVGDNIGIVLDNLRLDEFSLLESDFSGPGGLGDVTANPEPGTIFLLASGLGALLWRRRARSY